MFRSLQRAVVLLCLSCTASSFAAPAPVAPHWDHDLALRSDAGYVQLRWEMPSDADVDWYYELQEATDATFADATPRMQGHADSYFISGLTNGEYHYRLRVRSAEEEPWSTWSEPVTLRVEHHSRRLALGLMGLGAVVFLATAGFLIAHRNDDDEPGTELST